MKKKSIITPILLAASPVISLYARNIDQVYFYSILVSLLGTLILAFFLFFCFKVVLKKPSKAGIISSLFLLLFFSYGHFVSWMQIFFYWKVSNYLILSIWIYVFILFLIQIRKSSVELHSLMNFFTVFALVLIVVPLSKVSLYKLKAAVDKNDFQNTSEIFEGYNFSFENQKNQLLDIYYIILDAHARADILGEIYSYDNSQFIDGLKERGFYVAEKSTANYPQSALSVSSSLNLEYINYLTQIVGPNSQDRRPLVQLIINNKANQFLEKRGYSFVTLVSGWTSLGKMTSADYDFAPPLEMNDFENILVNTTPIGLFGGQQLRYDIHRQRIMYTLECLPEIAEFEEPTFTYAHLVSPHFPFVFDRQGNVINQEGEFYFKGSGWHFRSWEDMYQIDSYTQQLEYTDKRILQVIDQILEKSDIPPIIILQSDHGPEAIHRWNNPSLKGFRERLSILNAYYLPNQGNDLLYQSITPVNSFRIVFNHYFGADYQLLEDRNYYAFYARPYHFIDVTDQIK